MNLIHTGPQNSPLKLILAHGAGAPSHSNWLNLLCEALAGEKIHTIRFNFPYMQKRIDENKKYPPNRKEVLLQFWQEVTEKLNLNSYFIGGKSMGGRIATMYSHSSSAKGIVCFGFPFHAPKKDPGERISHLKDLSIPTLIFQGTKDPMGTREEINTYPLSKSITLYWIEKGNHDLMMPKKSGKEMTQVMQEIASLTKVFMEMHVNK